MPRYRYVCGCGEEIVRAFTMRDVLTTVSCERCGGAAKRVFTAPQVKTSTLFSEANQRGLAELDSTRRTDEAAYARNWNRRLPDL